jgi:hypothetical protein
MHYVTDEQLKNVADKLTGLSFHPLVVEAVVLAVRRSRFPSFHDWRATRELTTDRDGDHVFQYMPKTRQDEIQIIHPGTFRVFWDNDYKAFMSLDAAELHLYDLIQESE